MKKFTISLLSALTALPLLAQSPSAKPVISVPGSNPNIVSKIGQTYNPFVAKSGRFLVSEGGSAATGVARAAQSNVPDGDESYYTIDMDLLTQDGGTTFALTNETSGATMLVKQTDNKVSLLCPFNYYTGKESSFIEGTMEGNKMTFALPAVVDEVTGIDMILSMHRYDPEGNTYVPIEDGENVLEVEVGEDGTLTILTSDITYDSVNVNDGSTLPEIVLGVSAYMSGSDIRLGFVWGTWNTDFNPITLNSVPEGTVFEEWTLCQEDPEMKYTLPGWNRLAGVAINGNDIYIKNISEYSEDSIIKGTIENGVATFSGIQAAGFCPRVDYICYFAASEATLTGTAIQVGEDTSLRMALDMDNKTLKSKDVMMWCLVDPETRTYVNAWFEPMCIANIPENLNAPLENPSYSNGSDMTGADMGYLLVFYIPNINVNGCVLDKSKIYYNLYLNGDLYTFNKDQYFTLPEDLTDIPADFTDPFYFANQITLGAEIYGIWCWYFDSELYTVGVQSFYEGSNGELYVSALNEVNPGFYSGVSNPETESASAVSEEYFTLEGMKVSKPTSGIYVKVSHLSDGSRKVEKIML